MGIKPRSKLKASINEYLGEGNSHAIFPIATSHQGESGLCPKPSMSHGKKSLFLIFQFNFLFNRI